MQDPKEIEEHYKNPDPWGYKTNPEDKIRKAHILSLIEAHAEKFRKGQTLFERAVDIGAGEGWITEALPAKEIFGYEISDTAASRFPENVKRVLAFEGKYDLILATGVMYDHYDVPSFIKMIKEHARGLVVLVNIKAWESPLLRELGGTIYEEDFPYCDFIEHVRVYDFSD